MNMIRGIIALLGEITADGWISFIGSIIGAVITAISILVAIYQSRLQINQQKITMLVPYYESLLQSLPCYDKIMTQADYLNEDDNLLGGFTSSESKLYILEERVKDVKNDNDRSLLEYKIKKQKEYLEYWNQANKKIEDFMSDGYFNAIKSACNGDIISCYYDFVVAFHNEHYYCGPVIDTDLLRNNLVRLMEAINKAKK
ncbi:MAG: hypothetical protein Q4D26_11665 [Clostridia bacterium]|nr:hypothetical protein [Clostridia bacterium]